MKPCSASQKPFYKNQVANLAEQGSNNILKDQNRWQDRIGGLKQLMPAL